MKKTIALFLALLMLVSCLTVLSSCGKKTTDVVSVCLASEPATIDPALNSAVDGATMILHAFSGLVGYQPNDEGVLELVADCAKELPEAVKNDDGTVTYTFELKSGLKWSDGSELTADDFVYAWNRAVDPMTTADYAYMFEIIDGYADVQDKYELDDEGSIKLDDDGNPVVAHEDAKLNVTADGNKISIVLKNDIPYFFELLAFPTYMPVKKSVVEADPDGWATKPETYIGNGAYIMTEWTQNSKIVYVKNENYHDADSVTVNEIDFYLSDDANNMLTNFKNSTWQFIDDVPTAEIASLKTEYPDEFFVTGQLGTYYVIFNVNVNLLPEASTLTGNEKEKAQAEIRQAISLFFDRNYIVEEIGQAGQVPASSFVAMGLTDADGATQFYKNAGHSDDYTGYYNVAKEAFEANCTEAVEILKKYYAYDESTKKFTDFPSMTYLYNKGEGHKAIGEYLQSALAVYGIKMNLENQEWNTFLETRKNGDYSIARNGWLGDYNDPISFLDMWTTSSGNNDAQFGRDAHKDAAVYSVDLTPYGGSNIENGTWAETFDPVIAMVKAEPDIEKRYALMHIAEDLLMESGAIVPLYYYTDIFMCASELTDVYTSPLGYKYFMWATLETE